MDHPTPRLPKEEVEACEKEAGANIQDLKNKGGSLNEELAEKGDCLRKCILTKEGALKSDGTIDLDEFKVIIFFNHPAYMYTQLIFFYRKTLLKFPKKMHLLNWLVSRKLNEWKLVKT